MIKLIPKIVDYTLCNVATTVTMQAIVQRLLRLYIFLL